MKVNQIETPALILDKDVFMSNISKMNEILENTNASLRPHYKSNKCIDIAWIQIKSGAKGITCAKLGEAEDLVEAGIADILIANQVVQPSKLKRLANLAGKSRITVCVDSEENIQALSAAAKEEGTTIYCLIEFEIGMKRCGVTTFEEAAKLTKLIDDSEGLVFEGIQAYAGHLSHETDYEFRKAETLKNIETVANLKAYLENEGFVVKEVSGSSTGSVEFKAPSDVYTEIQTGSYIFMDAAYNKMDLPFESSLFVLSTVISTKTDAVITDAGVKACGVDQGLPECVGIPCDTEIALNEEHGLIYLKGHDYKINDKIRYIPGHCCSTINLYDKIYLISGDEVVDIIEITSRGKSI